MKQAHQTLCDQFTCITGKKITGHERKPSAIIQSTTENVLHILHWCWRHSSPNRISCFKDALQWGYCLSWKKKSFPALSILSFPCAELWVIWNRSCNTKRNLIHKLFPIRKKTLTEIYKGISLEIKLWAISSWIIVGTIVCFRRSTN